MVDVGRVLALGLTLSVVGCSESSEGVVHTGGTAGTGGSGGSGGQAGQGGAGGSAGSGGAGASAPECFPLVSAPIPTFDTGDQLVTEPFVGVRVIHRTTDQPRPLSYQVVQILPDTEGIGFRVTPQNGNDPRETTRQTTRAFLEQESAQLAINAHFFGPFPPVDAYANLSGIAASDGDAYSPFEGIHTFGFNLDPSNQPAVIIQAAGDTTGYATEPAVTLHNTVGAREQIVTAGTNTASWEELHPRTAIGITSSGIIVMVVVDGRQDGISEGMSTPEMAAVLIQDFDVVDAINLDGGGSTTFAVADPSPRLSNTTVNGAERVVGSSLAVFASPCRTAEPGSELFAYEGFDYPHRDWGTDSANKPPGEGLLHLMGGSGWGSAWFESFEASRYNGVALFPADAGTGADARTSPLSFTDTTNATLLTLGGQARTSFGTGSKSIRHIDMSTIDPSMLTAQSTIGANGTTLWISFLAQSFSDAGDGRYAYVALGEHLRLGKVGDTTGNWGVADPVSAATEVGTIPSDDPVFFVAKVDFAAGDEQAAVWLNPPLASEPSSPQVTLTVGDFTFTYVTVEGRYSSDFDEIRLGTSYQAVAPVAP